MSTKNGNWLFAEAQPSSLNYSRGRPKQMDFNEGSYRFWSSSRGGAEPKTKQIAALFSRGEGKSFSLREEPRMSRQPAWHNTKWFARARAHTHSPQPPTKIMCIICNLRYCFRGSGKWRASGSLEDRPLSVGILKSPRNNKQKFSLWICHLKALQTGAGGGI